MKILVIGNGFDLAHKLPTKYQNFLDFVGNYNWYKIKNNKKTYKLNGEDTYDKYKDYFENLTPELKNEYTELIQNNMWFKHFEKRFRENLKYKQNWIDFEAEISAVIQELDEIRKNTNKKIATEFDLTPYSLLNDIINEFSRLAKGKNAIPVSKYDKSNPLKENLINDLNRLTRCLELYLCDYISYIHCKKQPFFENLNPDHVINFNYTSTYSTVYLSEKEALGEHVPDIHYIHGQAIKGRLSEDCNLVLGIEEYLEGSDRDKDNEYIEFKKFYQRIFKGTGNNYKQWLENYNLTKTVKKDKLYTYIFGHSIATTDGDVIKDLIEASTQTIIYYYRKSDLHDIILNLVQIIGEDDLIKRTSSDDCSIIFKPNP